MTPDEKVAWALSVARHHLGMDLSWLARFVGDDQVLEAVSGESRSFGVYSGARLSHPGSYCARVLAGTLPPAVADARHDSRTADLAVTDRLDIGAYVGAPVVLEGGRVYGMLCCLSHRAVPELRERDATFLAVVAELLSDSVAELHRHGEHRQRTIDRVMDVIRSGGPDIVFQPVVELTTGRTVGAEALARFPAGSGGPERWFADADEVGLGTELEVAAVTAAVAEARAHELPAGVTLAVNASAATVAAGPLAEVLADGPAGGVMVEITEHQRIEDYPATRAGLADLRALGVSTAVDDVGVGYAGLHQLVQLLPDVVKMDIDLTRGIETDPARRALASALVRFAHDIGATLLAEGVETRAQLVTLTDLGVDLAQGMLLGPPGPLPLPLPPPLPPPLRLSAGAPADRPGPTALPTRRA